MASTWQVTYLPPIPPSKSCYQAPDTVLYKAPRFKSVPEKVKQKNDPPQIPKRQMHTKTTHNRLCIYFYVQCAFNFTLRGEFSNATATFTTLQVNGN
uniref:Uncharacterized protein n=1 Tax=Anguilla anguilla TaxID=7936 RepID=A0A0E9Y143_ANGAN